MIEEQVKTALLTSLQGMIARVMAESGLSEAQVRTIIGTYFANDAEAIDNTNTEKLVSPKGAYLAAKAAIDEWVGSAPELLDTIQEIANALNNDPDAFNTLMNAINATNAGLNAHGTITPINFSETGKDALINGSLASFEAVDLGTYLGYVNPVTAGLTAADHNVVEDKPGLMTVVITPFTLEGTDPEAGEENRKIVHQEFQQGNLILVRNFDTLSADKGIWVIAGGGEQGAGNTIILTPADIIVPTTGAAAAKLIAAGVYAGWSAGAEATWLSEGLSTPLTNPRVDFIVTVAPGTADVAERIMTFTCISKEQQWTVVYDSTDNSRTTVEGATQAAIDASQKETIEFLAASFDLMGYPVGSAILSSIDGRTFTDTQATGAHVTVGVLDDGTLAVMNSDGDVEVGMVWLPYGAVASDYQVHFIDGTGTAEAFSGTTMGTTPAAIVAGEFGSEVGVGRLTANDGAGTTTAEVEIVLTHVPTNKTTSATVTFSATVS